MYETKVFEKKKKIVRDTNSNQRRRNVQLLKGPNHRATEEVNEQKKQSS